MLASLERLKEERERIAAAVAVLGQAAPNAHFILEYKEGQGAQDLANSALKALAILKGRDQG